MAVWPYAQRAMPARFDLPPPAERRQDQVNPGKQLVQPLGVLGQESALQQFVHWLAVIYKRWVGRGGESSNEFRMGVAYMALMCCPGPGKSEFLTSLLPQLLAWLDSDKEDLLQFLRSAMYSYTVLRPEEQKNVQDFLPALEGLAGKRSEWHMVFLLRVNDAPTADLERKLGLDESSASALRLLHASCLLWTLAMSIRRNMQNLKRIWTQTSESGYRWGRSSSSGAQPSTCRLRRQCVARVTFVSRTSKKKATWVKELLSEVILEMNHMPCGKPPTLIVPLTAATTWTSWDLSPEDSWSVAWNSTAVQLFDRSGHAGPSDCDARELSKKTSFYGS
ncbi:g3229 [Coccomyxa elongata]